MSPERTQFMPDIATIPTKALLTRIAPVLLAVVALLTAFTSDAQSLLITYHTPSGQGIGTNTVRFAQNSSDSPYVAYPSPPSLEIYCLRADGSKKTRVAIRTSNEAAVREIYRCPLEYNGDIPDGTPHSLRFRVTGIANGHALSNAIVTAKIEKGSLTNVIDVKKLIYESLEVAEIPLGTTTNAVSGSNGLVTVIVEPPERVQISISRTNANQIHLATLVQPGASLIVYSLPTAQPLDRWTADVVANMYVPVTLENFGSTQPVSLTIDANENQRFFAAEVSTCRYYPGFVYDPHCR